MGIEREHSVWCDGDGCVEWHGFGTARTKAQAAKQARYIGWTSKGTQWFCPACIRTAKAKGTTQADSRAANEALRQERAEVERLRDIIQHVVAGMGHSGSEAPESLPCNESCVGCDEDTIGERHRAELPEDRCSDHPDAYGEIDCWRCLLTAAITPRPVAKES